MAPHTGLEGNSQAASTQKAFSAPGHTVGPRLPPTMRSAGRLVLGLRPCPQDKGCLHKALTVCARRGAGFPRPFCFILSGGCLHLLSASCVLAACGGPRSLPCTGDPQGLQPSSPKASPLLPVACTPRSPLDAGRPPGAGSWTSQLPVPQTQCQGSLMPTAPAPPPCAPADKLQALGPCRGSDSVWGAEATLGSSLAGSRVQVSVPTVTGLTALHGLGARRGLEALLSSRSCPWTCRVQGSEALSWALSECPPLHPCEPQS